MNWFGAESGMKAEAVVYFLDFPHSRQGGFVGFAKFAIESRSGARRGQNRSPE
jgi:hypothetical protein